MSRVEVPMPQMGESIAEGTVSVWLKEIGQRVERDEPIMEISTDKVEAEIPSPAEGTLVEIFVKEGETVEVGAVVALIETDPAAAAGAASMAAETPAIAERVPPSAGSASGTETGTAEESVAAAVAEQDAGAATGTSAASSEPSTAAETTLGSDERPRPDGGEVPSAASPASGGAVTLEDRIRTRSSPLVRRMAEEHGIDIRRIEGTGRLGRVTKDDILAYIRNGGPESERPSRQDRVGRAVDWDEFYSEVQHPLVQAAPQDRVEPMGRMTSLIAEHMVISQRISPHVYSFFEIDYSRIDQVRAAQQVRWAEQGVKVSYTAFIARAVAGALREHPKLNASISGTDIIYRSEVNLGIAVALPWGLIVPVVRHADELSLVGLAHRVSDLAHRARSKKLSPEEVQGGTFTITNPGIFGTVIGFPIINQPQVAILCVGGIEKRPVVITDEFGNDGIVARQRGFISLGFDHRLVNGADGDSFLARVKELLESASES